MNKPELIKRKSDELQARSISLVIAVIEFLDTLKEKDPNLLSVFSEFIRFGKSLNGFERDAYEDLFKHLSQSRTALSGQSLVEVLEDFITNDCVSIIDAFTKERLSGFAKFLEEIEPIMNQNDGWVPVNERIPLYDPDHLECVQVLFVCDSNDGSTAEGMAWFDAYKGLWYRNRSHHQFQSDIIGWRYLDTKSSDHI